MSGSWLGRPLMMIGERSAATTIPSWSGDAGGRRCPTGLIPILLAPTPHVTIGFLVTSAARSTAASRARTPTVPVGGHLSTISEVVSGFLRRVHLRNRAHLGGLLQDGMHGACRTRREEDDRWARSRATRTNTTDRPRGSVSVHHKWSRSSAGTRTVTTSCVSTSRT